MKKLIVAAVVAIAPAAIAQEGPAKLVGAWKGTYTCVGNRADLTLIVPPAASSAFYTAEFHFTTKPPGVTLGLSGSYKMSVVWMGQDTFEFMPSDWIKKPPGDGWEMIGLAGKLGTGNTLVGTVTEPRCEGGKFEVKRTG